MNIARSGEELLKICDEEGISLSEYAIRTEMENRDTTREDIIKRMKNNLRVMQEAAYEGMENEVYSVSGLIGGD